MSNIVNLKAYRDAKAKAKFSSLEEVANWWIAYWFWLAGIK